MEWTREEEAKYKANRLAQEVRTLQKVDDDDQNASDDKAKPGKSKSQKTPDKDAKCVFIFMAFCHLLFFLKICVCMFVAIVVGIILWQKLR